MKKKERGVEREGEGRKRRERANRGQQSLLEGWEGPADSPPPPCSLSHACFHYKSTIVNLFLLLHNEANKVCDFTVKTWKKLSITILWWKEGRLTSVSTARRGRAIQGPLWPSGGHCLPQPALPILLALSLYLFVTSVHPLPCNMVMYDPPTSSNSLPNLFLSFPLPSLCLPLFPSMFWIPCQNHTGRPWYDLACLEPSDWGQFDKPWFYVISTIRDDKTISMETS